MQSTGASAVGARSDEVREQGAGSREQGAGSREQGGKHAVSTIPVSDE